MHEAEGSARAILQSAGYHIDDNPGLRAVAVKILGSAAIRVVQPGAIGWAKSELAMAGGGARIWLSSREPRSRWPHLIGHELGHLYLGHHGHGSAELEELCDAIGGALTCPRAAFESAVGRLGLRLGRLAREFCTTQTSAALRLGEVLRRPTAVVTPGRVRFRGDAWGWPPEAETRLLRPPRSPVEKIRIGDEPNRFALLAAA